MGTGETGHSGLAAPRHVDQGQEAGQGSVTTQLQPMEAETVKNQAVRQKIVTQTTVQVKPLTKCLSLCLSIAKLKFCLSQGFPRLPKDTRGSSRLPRVTNRYTRLQMVTQGYLGFLKITPAS